MTFFSAKSALWNASRRSGAGAHATSFAASKLPFAVSACLSRTPKAAARCGTTYHVEFRPSSPLPDLTQESSVEYVLNSTQVPGKASYMTQLMLPYVQQHQRDVSAAEDKVYRAASPRSKPSLLALPDSALELIAAYTSPASAATLQISCQHLFSLLSDDRVWRYQLALSKPAWLAHGVSPDHAQGLSWKHSVIASCTLQRRYTQVLSENPADLLSWTSKLWDAGDKLQLDLHLFNMVTESRQALAADPTRLQLKFIHAANLLDSVYFLWFDQQQLTRGAKHLAEAVDLLVELLPLRTYTELWGSASGLAASTAAAGSFLLDLLDMRCMRNTTMSMQSPHNFIWLGTGHQGFVVVEPEPSSSSFEWYGAQYSQHDLAEALAEVSGSEDRYEHLLSLSSGRYRLPASVARPVWQQVFNANAVLLLDTLATFPQEEDFYLGTWPGEALQAKGEQYLFESSLSRYDACKAYQLLVGYSLHLRLGCLDKEEDFSSHAKLFTRLKQHSRAAYLLKMDLLIHQDSFDTAVKIADAYFQDWRETGSCESMRSAFAWQKGSMAWYLRCDSPLPEWRNAFLSCLESFIKLLQANRSSGQHSLDMQCRREDFLIVGAGMAALDLLDPSKQILHWVHEHAEATRLAWSCLIRAVLDGGEVAEHLRIQHCRVSKAALALRSAPSPGSWANPQSG